MTPRARQPEYGVEPAAADWLVELLRGELGTVGGTVPVGYEAYVRILHPVEIDPWITWSDVATKANRVVHPLVQWHRLVEQTGVRETDHVPNSPLRGHLVDEALWELIQLLRPHTTTPEECYFCTWTGYGWDVASGGTVAAPDRSYFLGGGPLESAINNGSPGSVGLDQPQSPNLFWPVDRAWVVATEVDFDSTIVACSAQCAGELLASSKLESLPVRLGDSLRYDSDELN